MRFMFMMVMFITALGSNSQSSCPIISTHQIVQKAGHPQYPLKSWWVLRVYYTSPTSGKHTISWRVENSIYNGCWESVEGNGMLQTDTLELTSVIPAYTITPMTGRYCNGASCAVLLPIDLDPSPPIWDGIKITWPDSIGNRLLCNGKIVATKSPFYPNRIGEYMVANNSYRYSKTIYIAKLPIQTRWLVYQSNGQLIQTMILPAYIPLIRKAGYYYKQIN